MTILTALCLLLAGFAMVVALAFAVMVRSGCTQPPDMGMGEWETQSWQPPAQRPRTPCISSLRKGRSDIVVGVCLFAVSVLSAICLHFLDLTAFERGYRQAEAEQAERRESVAPYQGSRDWIWEGLLHSEFNRRYWLIAGNEGSLVAEWTALRDQYAQLYHSKTDAPQDVLDRLYDEQVRITHLEPIETNHVAVRRAHAELCADIEANKFPENLQ